jgi:hypothetical protein
VRRSRFSLVAAAQRRLERSIRPLGGLMLVLFKSNCLKIKCCFGLVQCTRRPPSIDDEVQFSALFFATAV